MKATTVCGWGRGVRARGAQVRRDRLWMVRGVGGSDRPPAGSGADLVWGTGGPDGPPPPWQTASVDPPPRPPYAPSSTPLYCIIDLIHNAQPSLPVFACPACVGAAATPCAADADAHRHTTPTRTPHGRRYVSARIANTQNSTIQE
jgi:hypothetical protein